MAFRFKNMLQQYFGRKTEDLEENERTSESKMILSIVIPNQKVHNWTRPVTKTHKMLDFILLLWRWELIASPAIRQVKTTVWAMNFLSRCIVWTIYYILFLLKLFSCTAATYAFVQTFDKICQFWHIYLHTQRKKSSLSKEIHLISSLHYKSTQSLFLLQATGLNLWSCKG